MRAIVRKKIILKYVERAVSAIFFLHFSAIAVGVAVVSMVSTGNCKSCRQKCDKMSDNASLNLGWFNNNDFEEGKSMRESQWFESSIDRKCEIPHEYSYLVPTRSVWAIYTTWQQQRSCTSTTTSKWKKIGRKERKYLLYCRKKVTNFSLYSNSIQN